MSDVRNRIREIAWRDVPHEWADHPLALARLERWLRASSNPATVLDVLESTPTLGTALRDLLNLSAVMTDVLVQNPELGFAILEAEWVDQTPSVRLLLEEGERLLEAAHSSAHRWDRLRWMRQAWMLRIAVADLGGFWPPSVVWRALSDLADAILELSVTQLWEGFAREKGLPPQCPLEIIAFGKLGGQELNLWSDVDLVYVIPDDTSDADEVLLTRFSTMLNRGLAEPMGRGALYKVDLRLRPFGGRGAAVSRWKAVESYYANYAETWEHLALIRSRCIRGDAVRWEQLRQKVCFSTPRGSWDLEGLLRQRSALETIAEGDDLKRGPGGIRDIEFLTQILQLVMGHASEAVRVRPTLDALEALVQLEAISASDGAILASGYAWLRQLEHRIQMRDLRQTHAVPTEPAARAELAAAMHLDLPAFERRLQEVREEVRKKYEAFTHTLSPDGPGAAAPARGAHSKAVERWLNQVERNDEVADALMSNHSSAARVERLLAVAPRLMEAAARDLAVLEHIVTGEVQEREVSRRSALHAWIYWALDPNDSDPAQSVTINALRTLSADLRLAVVAMGSLAMGTTRWNSDLDLVLVGTSEESLADARTFRDRLTAQGYKVDFRLRPEGRNGPIATTQAVLEHYDLTMMEAWERMAFGRSLLVSPRHPELDALLGRLAFRVALNEEKLDELMRMKTRMEQERVNPRHAARHLKLGPGGANDIEWLAGLAAWGILVPSPRTATPVVDILRLLQRSDFLDSVECTLLVDSYLEITRWRRHLALISEHEDLVPENPDKLQSLAMALGLPDENAVLKHHEERSRSVRALTDSILDRIRSAVSR